MLGRKGMWLMIWSGSIEEKENNHIKIIIPLRLLVYLDFSDRVVASLCLKDFY